MLHRDIFKSVVHFINDVLEWTHCRQLSNKLQGIFDVPSYQWTDTSLNVWTELVAESVYQML